MKLRHPIFAALVMVAFGGTAPAGVKVSTARQPADDATPEFKIGALPRPWVDDAARNATFTVVGGTVQRKSGGVKTLNDGEPPAHSDDPPGNFSSTRGPRAAVSSQILGL
jgi:hypothetical protein